MPQSVFAPARAERFRAFSYPVLSLTNIADISCKRNIRIKTIARGCKKRLFFLDFKFEFAADIFEYEPKDQDCSQYLQ